MTGRKELLSNYKEEYGGSVKFGNNELSPVVGHGDIACEDITINNVAHVEGLNHNLFSIGKFCDKDLEVNFNKRRCAVRTELGIELLVGTRKTNLYTIKLRHMLTNKSQCLITKKSSHQSLLWHRRLSHLYYRYLDRLVKQSFLSPPPLSQNRRTQNPSPPGRFCCSDFTVLLEERSLVDYGWTKIQAIQIFKLLFIRKTRKNHHRNGNGYGCNTTTAPPAWWLRLVSMINRRASPQRVVAAPAAVQKFTPPGGWR
ncbi:hypothetical protein OSB04_002590 [Centaurea solstitialis]|uniref:GAG-pre-integrase domain-containing protein n=1 Tax=Centaurea solstitialis TaxID=347529 RepID=A0AA38TTN2_9ASTR|nr:hypothetical protein OSB04_002590 [Centaurea solstitialis]